MNDIDVKIHPEWDNFAKGLDKFRKKFKYFLFEIKVFGNLGIIYFLIKHDWFNAFLMFVIFFPEEVSIIRVIKSASSKSINAFKDKHRHHNDTKTHDNQTDKGKTEPSEYTHSYKHD